MDEPNMLTGDAATADTTAAAEHTAADTSKDAGAATTTAADEAGKDVAGEGAKDTTKTEDQDAPKGAPEAYEAFKVPEGYVLDEQLLGEFTPVLKDLNLSQDQAQKLIDFAPKLVEQTVQTATSKVLEQVGFADYAQWPTQVKKDQEIGGDKLAENLAVAKKARDQFATPELRKLLDTTPMGNHPEIIRLFHRIGKAISEDGYVPGGKATTANTASRIYSASNMNP